jgi:hypothetical protein
VFFQRANFAERVGVVKREQALGKFIVVREIYFAEAGGDLFQRGRAKAGLRKSEAQRINVVAKRNATK